MYPLHRLSTGWYCNRIASSCSPCNYFSFITVSHIGTASPKMQIHIQFHGSESTQNSLNPAMQKNKEVQRCDRLDKMIHAVLNSLGCQALLAFIVSGSFMSHYTPKEYWSEWGHSVWVEQLISLNVWLQKQVISDSVCCTQGLMAVMV